LCGGNGYHGLMPRRAADDRVRLLHGPYRAPNLHAGDRAQCLFRDCLVEVKSWTDARIPWPRGVPVGGRGQPSILVDEELARAIRTEAAVAVRYWWGAAAALMWRWRKALDAQRGNNPGSQRLILAASAKGADALRGVPLSEEQVEQRRRSALENNLAQYFQPGYHGEWWTAEEIALLGTLPDWQVARRIERSQTAVRQKRAQLGIPNPADRRRRR
jgi:hypothetical protein